MATGTPSWKLVCVSVTLLAAVGLVAPLSAQNIYKCTQDGHVSYTDVPCPGNHGELLHQASDADVIDQYLRLGQDDRAKAYAHAHHLDALYAERLAAHEQQAQDRAQRAEADAAAARQSAEAARQQALADAAADSAELRAQNQLLRQQNDQYQEQLSGPGYYPAPYWPILPTYGGYRPGAGHGHDNRPPKAPAFHPCTYLAGGRVTC